jgi:pyruvate kinase
VETPLEQVPLHQKRMIETCLRYGKTVITATQMMASMEQNAFPTRAEVSDVANAILDHTDAVMLSNESAVGKYPVEAVKTLYETSKYTEDEMKHHENFLPKSKKLNPISSVDAACFSAVELAENLQAKYIIAITESGFTAEQVSKFRPKTPVIAITNHQKTVQWLQLVWGLQKIFLQVTHQNSTNFSEIKKLLKEKNLVKPGDKVVIISHKNDQQLICPISI